MELLVTFAFIIAYLIGNISPSTLLAKAKGIDIKSEGSGNAGTTNALRVMGRKAAIITLIIDILKGAVAVAVGWFMAGEAGAMGCVLCVVVGHIWPVFLIFRGGKGIATSFGALLALDPIMALIELGIVAVFTLVSKRMSVGSIAGLALLPVVALFMMPQFIRTAIVMAAIMIFKHRANIIRLIHGEEPKLSFLDKKSNKEDKNNQEDEDREED